MADNAYSWAEIMSDVQLPSVGFWGDGMALHKCCRLEQLRKLVNEVGLLSNKSTYLLHYITMPFPL